MKSNVAGTAVGTTMAFIKSLFIFSFITWQTVIDTAVITFLGGVCGYLGSEFIKWTSKKVRKWVS